MICIQISTPVDQKTLFRQTIRQIGPAPQRARPCQAGGLERAESSLRSPVVPGSPFSISK